MPHAPASWLFWFLFLLALATSCSPVSSPPTDHSLAKKAKQPVLAIQNVTVIPMSAPGKVLANVTVIISQGRIASLDGPIPAEAQIIDGRGKWLMPGLMDMHVHVPTDIHFGPSSPTQAASIFFDTQDVMTPYIANGVTTLFDLNSKAEHFGQRNQVARGDVIGPRMALAALINGGDGSGRIVNTAADGRQAVRSAQAEGYAFIKVYSQLNVETYRAIVEEAAKQGMKTIGHLPNAFQGKLEQAFMPALGMVAHAEEFSKQTTEYSDQDAQRFAQLMKAHGTWLSPTLTAMERILSQARSLDELRASPLLAYVHPLLQSKWLTANNYNRGTSAEIIAHLEQMVEFHPRLVRACQAAGVPMVVGTDTGVSGVMPGFAVHDEIQLLVAAGMTPEEALASATRLPATWLGIDREVGTVEVGKRADLLLLEANPLSDVKNTRKIAGVCVNGRWLDRSTLEAMLADLAKRNMAAKEDYDWQKRKDY